ncbi:MAG: HAD family hydrolase [Firmicutes bacterium]|nr:HAD family hydrolase [Bacillota bacterium]
MYKNCVFDVYGTLIDIRTNEYDLKNWEQLTKTLAFYGVNYSAEELKNAYFTYCDYQVQQGSLNYEYPEVDVVEVFRSIFENKGKKIGKVLAKHIAQEFRALSTEYIRVYDGVTDTLAKLKKAGKKLYILSNAQKCFTQQELINLDLPKYFKGIAYSSDYKCAKPDAALFEVITEKFKLKKEETIYVGNDAFCDVNGAHNAKLDCLLIKTNLTNASVQPKRPPEYTVDNGDFTEIARLLLNN